MARTLVLVVLAALALPATGIVDMIEQTCEDTCPDDGSDGQCAPGCSDCVCCAHPRLVVFDLATTVVLIAARDSFVLTVDGQPQSVDPDEILDVPKLPRAA